MKFEREYFIKQKFTEAELKKYGRAIRRDLGIAGESRESEVTFHFTFMALIKIGIYCLAQQGYRVKSRPGHHQKIIESLSEFFQSEDVLIVGEKMRKDRNLDFYGAEVIHSPDEVQEYFKFVEDLYKKI